MAVMRYQPQGLPRIDQSHPLASGLRIAILPGVNRAYDAATLRPATPTGMKLTTMPSALAAGFGSTLGAGSTDKIITGLSGAFPAGRSYYFRARRNGQGGGGLGRLFDKTNGSTGQMIYWSNGSNALVHSFYGGGSEQIHVIAGTSTTAAVGVDFDLLITHSQSGSNTVINAYVNGVLVSGNTYSITFNDAATTALTIGNRASDNLRGWDGLIECAYIVDRVLTADDAMALRANRYQLFAAPYDDEDIVTSGPSPATGQLIAQLDHAGMASSGIVVNPGAFASSSANSTMSASGSVGAAPSGIFASTSSSALMSASGNVVASGIFSAISDNAMMSANGSSAQPVSGTFAATTANATILAFGYLGDTPPAVQTRRYRWRILRRFIAN